MARAGDFAMSADADCCKSEARKYCSSVDFVFETVQRQHEMRDVEYLGSFCDDVFCSHC